MESLQKDAVSSTAQFCLLRGMPEARLAERIRNASTFEGKSIPPILFGSAASNLFTERKRVITDLDYVLPEAACISVTGLKSAGIKVLAIHQDSDGAMSQYNMLDLVSGDHVTLVMFPQLLYQKMLIDSPMAHTTNQRMYVIHPAFLVALKCRRVMYAKSSQDLEKIGTDRRDIREIIRSVYGNPAFFRRAESDRLASYRIRHPEQESMHNVIDDAFKKIRRIE